MKRILVTISLFFVFSVSYSQHYFIQYSVPNNGEVGTSNLFIRDTISVFQRVPMPTEKPSLEKRFFVKNTQTGISLFSEKLFSLIFYVSDSAHNMKWELLNDTARVLNELCLTAKTTFRGREYIAYYAPKYPISNGPWKFGGLPGLILLVKSTDNYVEWRAEKIIENYSGDFPVPNIEGLTFLKWDEFEKKYKETINNYIKLVRSNGTLAPGSTTTLKITSVEIFYPKLHTGEGITF